MKKIAFSLVAVVAAFTTSCVSNEAQACLNAAECVGEEDPAAFCEDAKADTDEACADDENCTKIKEACAAEADAVAACTVANGTCEDEVFGATIPEDCEAEIEASTDCATDATAE